MKRLITGVLAAVALSASAQEREESKPSPPHVPAEILSIQQSIPVVPDSRAISNFAIHGRVDAVTGQIGSVTAGTVSNIGSAVPTGSSIPVPIVPNLPTVRIR